MVLSLPGPIAHYFAADLAGDASAVARCFTADAVVRDEGGTFTGSPINLRHIFRIAGDKIVSLEIRQ